jgi:hypothetical protein
MTYDTIILLARGIHLDEQGAFNFTKDGRAITYKTSGDPFEFCYKAVKKLHENGTQHIILVGGVVKGAEYISKPDIMEDVLVNRYGIPQSCLTKIVSESNTEGNAKAVKEFHATNTIAGNAGLLTNHYHLLRAMRDFVNIPNLRLLPVPAESIIYTDTGEFENIRTFYENEGLSYIIGNTPDANSEIKGIADKELGTYKSGIS